MSYQDVCKICLEESCSFLSVARSLNRDAKGLLDGKMFVLVTNALFSCELSLKGIIMFLTKEEETIRIHYLTELFGLLPDDSKEKIREMFSQKCSSELDDVLKKYNNAFVDFRYAFTYPVDYEMTEILELAGTLNGYLVNLMK